MIIPAQVIALITFPGIIVHEIAHRLFCDLTNVDVYEIRYFSFWSKKAGHVIHARTDNLTYALLISLGPLIVNTLLCIVLTFPYGSTLVLGTDFVPTTSPLIGSLHMFVLWVGYSIGFSALPSNQDMAGLVELAPTHSKKQLLFILTKIIELFNVDYIGTWLQFLYAYTISLALPTLFLMLFNG